MEQGYAMADLNTPENSEIIHASTVAHAGRAVVIRGASGAGKSGLALQLLALGSELVADDRTRIWVQDDRVMSDAPQTIQGKIEVRGVGILASPACGSTPVALVVDLDHAEAQRLPVFRYTDLLGIRLPLLHRADFVHFPAAILLYLRNGRVD